MQPRSPIRYPGGKTQIAPLLANLVQRGGSSSVVSPFVGGCSVEITLARRGIRVHGGDLFGPLVNFWRWALTDAPRVAHAVHNKRPVSRETFEHMKATLKEGHGGDVDSAAHYFLINRSSFGGAGTSGRFAPGTPNLHDNAVWRLHEFSCPGLTVEHADFRATLRDHPGSMVFADPPYPLSPPWKERLYGWDGDLHQDFDHDALADALRGRAFVLCYRDCSMVRDLYSGHDIRPLDRRHRLGPKPTTLNELVIMSAGLL